MKRAVGQLLLILLVPVGGGVLFAGAQQLPNAPSAVLEASSRASGDAEAAGQATPDSGGNGATNGNGQVDVRPCLQDVPDPDAGMVESSEPSAAEAAQPGAKPGTDAVATSAVPAKKGCSADSQIQPIVIAGHTTPLTAKKKGWLAVRDVLDPFNLLTIVGYSGVSVAANAHSAYGPGLEGWGRLTGYGLVENMQGEFFGTFLIPTIAHQDPRYHRMPDKPVPKRILHAIGHTFVSRHDDGSPMLNYATLLTYPISAELANLYVPGVETNAPSTARRIGIGIASDPAGTIVAEFLPDVARHIHIRVIFVQEILNQVIVGAPNMQ
jgi:hypothetical protein